MVVIKAELADTCSMELGDTIIGRYTIDGLAGRGGMGVVYRAHDSDGGLVAIKLLLGDESHQVERFMREARILVNLEHPAIVRCLDAGVMPGGQPFLVMEWLEGQDLRTHLEAGPLTADSVCIVGERVACALNAAHAQGMIHRDVKPANIFLVDGRPELAKLVDFGAARWSRAATLTATGIQLGTPLYMAPEQIRCERKLDGRADLFALGCVLYECLVGQAAFAGKQVMAVFYKILLERSPSIPSWVPDTLARLIERMLRKQPDQRPENADEVAVALQEIRVRMDDRASSPATGRCEILTTAENKLISVVVMAGQQELRDWLRTWARNTELAVDGVADLADTRAESATMRRLRAYYEPLGARFDRIGDGSLIAVLEARMVASDTAADAVRCALALRAEHPSKPIAVATGRAVLEGDRMLGEVIEHAIALLPSGSPASNDIKLDDVTAGLVSARFPVAQEADECLLRPASAAPKEPRLMGRPTPFVGRRSEMAALTAALDECIDEHVARVVIVTGPAGIGKSRLERELVAHAATYGSDVVIWRGYGDPMRAGSSLDLVAQLIRQCAGLYDNDPLESRRAKLSQRIELTVSVEDRRRLCIFLGEIVDTPWPDENDVQLQSARRDTRLMSEQQRRACVDFMAAETAGRPLLISLEDLQWSDQATISMFDTALRLLVKRPLFVAAFARPEVHDQFPGLWSTHGPMSLQLRPLSDRAATKLARSVLGTAIEDTRLSALARRAEGSPFYLEELLRNAAVGRWDAPETVLATVQARLQGLDEASRRTLRAASVFGDRFWRGSLRALLGSDVPLDAALCVLVAEELVAPVDASQFAGEREYQFRHDLIREAAYAMLVDSDRLLGHRLAGQWLAGVGERNALVVAEHFQRARENEEALPFFMYAARNALAAGNLELAASAAERGVACGAEGERLGAFRFIQGEANWWQGHHQTALAHASEALTRFAPGSRQWYDTQARLAYVYAHLGKLDLLEQMARALADVQPRDHDREGWLIAATSVSTRLLTDGRFDAASPLFSRVEQTIAEDEAVSPLIMAHLWHARAVHAHFFEGNPAALLRGMQESAKSHSQAGNLRQEYVIRCNIGFAQIEMGLYSEAVATLRAVLHGARAQAIPVVVDLAKQNLGLVLAYQGKLDEASLLARQSASALEERGNNQLTSASRGYLAIVAWLAGDLDTAEQQARRALELCVRRSEMHPVLLAVLARVLSTKGQPDEAAQHAIAAMEILRDFGGFVENDGLVHLIHAETLHCAGRLDDARRAILHARKRLLARANKIDVPEWRVSFLENVDHARTLQLAAQWCELMENEQG